MIEITKLVPELDYVYCSHTKPLVDPEILQKAADAFGMIRRGEVEYVSQEMYGLNLRLHTFNGFSILTKDD
jgi:hypothetical protein